MNDRILMRAALIAAALASMCLLQPIVQAAEGDEAAARKERKILYWVAPMDPNFRRDQPGKSPMGMDLVPVYEGEQQGGADEVRIDPAVVQNLGVRSAPVTRGDIAREIDTVGYVDFDERHISHVHLRTDGWVERLHVKSEGARVRKGELLFDVYSRELVSAQEEYLQAMRSGNRALETASRDRLAALGVEAQEIARIARERKALQLVPVRAHQDGIVARLNIREGMYVAPAAEIMSLADLSSVWIMVDVFERQADWVTNDLPAEVRVPYLPGKVWKGRVEYVYPNLDPKTRTLRARLRFDNPAEALKPGMYANVRLYADPRLDVLSIPREALIRTGMAERVIVALGEGRFRPAAVESGIETGDRVEIRKGLAEGDRVVISGQFLIDSEASLKGSFNRMEGDHGAHDHSMHGMMAPPEPAPIRGEGVVHSVAESEHRLNMTHDPIAALDWPAMTMDFQVADSVDLSTVRPDMRVRFTLRKGGAMGYEIVTLEPAPAAQTETTHEHGHTP